MRRQFYLEAKGWLTGNWHVTPEGRAHIAEYERLVEQPRLTRLLQQLRQRTKHRRR